MKKPHLLTRSAGFLLAAKLAGFTLAGCGPLVEGSEQDVLGSQE